MDTPAAELIDPTASKEKRRKNLVVASLITLILKAHSSHPIDIPNSVKILSVNDAFWKYLLTHGLELACNFFATVTLFLLIPYLFESINNFIGLMIKQQAEILDEVVEENPELVEKEDVTNTFQKFHDKTQDVRGNLAKLFNKYLEDNNMTLYSFSCASPLILLSFISYLIFDRLPAKFPFILAFFAITVCVKNIGLFFWNLL